MAASPRRSYEAGHRPRFLVVVDETPECVRAVYFAARRAARVGAEVALLAVLDPPEFQHWFGVGDVIQAEAEEEANRWLDVAAARARAVTGVEPGRAVRIGSRSGEILVTQQVASDIPAAAKIHLDPLKISLSGIEIEGYCVRYRKLTGA